MTRGSSRPIGSLPLAPVASVALVAVAILTLAGAAHPLTARAQVGGAQVGGTQVRGAQVDEGDAIHVGISTPAADSYRTGPVQLAAEITPPTDVAAASFFIDGREVCVVTPAPHACAWDAGRDVKEHQVRLVVTMRDGGRIVRTLRTKGLDFVGRSEVEAVQVTVTVMNDGKFVSGLPRTGFHVFEDGKAQAISSFVSENVPLEIVVAVDISGSMANSMPKLKEAVKDFLGAVPQTHQVTLLGFNDSIIPVTRRTTNPAERIKAVDRLAPWGTTALYDVIAQGVEMLGEQTGRKALIVFSDGEDQGSHLTLQEAEAALQASDVTLYMIGQGRGVSAEPLKKIMQRLAEPTGGRAMSTESIDKLHESFEELLHELSHQYLIGYQSTNHARDGGWRELKVEVDGPGRVRARKGYRAAGQK
jgi:Ca-activated chloride channel family protein